jgi:peptidoglycan/xylan/chitin deacetylase (PgdA/CDA1 family)
VSARGQLKAAIERGFVQSGIATFARRRRQHDTLVLAYHNVSPDSASLEGDRELHVTRSAFAAQLDALAATHEVVPLERVVDELVRRGTRANGAKRSRPLAAITFDDAYHGAVTLGVAELAKRGMPATIFVAPSFVGGRAFWWDELADPQSGLPDRVRERALEELEGRDAEIRAWARSAGIPERSAETHMCCATEEELDAAVHSGISLAPHTMSHPNLTRLHRQGVFDELTQSLDWLRARFARVTPFIAYPYGLSSPTVARAAADLGYRAGFLVRGGWIQRARHDDPYAMPRVNVPAGLSLEGFALRAAGMFCD